MRVEWSACVCAERTRSELSEESLLLHVLLVGRQKIKQSMSGSSHEIRASPLPLLLLLLLSYPKQKQSRSTVHFYAITAVHQ